MQYLDVANGCIVESSTLVADTYKSGLLPVRFQETVMPMFYKPANVLSTHLMADSAVIYVEPIPMNMQEILFLRETTVADISKNFEHAFAKIDAKAPRSARGVILAMVDGTLPDETTPNLTPEQKQRIIDVGIMWELEEVAQVNRDLLRELQSLTITEDMTLEEAQNVVRKARDMKPWLPWEPQNSAPQAPPVNGTPQT